MSHELVRRAFETRVQTWANSQGIDVAWENVSFTPVTDQPYAQVFVLPAKTHELFFDQTGRDFKGVFQVNLSMPLGTGPGTAEVLVDSLDSAFSGTFVQGSITVTLVTPMSPAPALPDADRYVIPVSAEYRVVTV